MNHFGERASNYRHGGHTINRPEYNSWRAMKARCNDPNYWCYHRYGGRGIKIDKQWLGRTGFNQFLKDMGKKPTPKHSLDRIDNNGDYTPENCRWSSQRQQVNNSSKIVSIELNGISKSISEWSRIYNINMHTVVSRVKQQGWSWEKAITTPTKGIGSNQVTY